MKLGMINGWFEHDFKYARAKGVDFSEFCINGDRDIGDFTERVDELNHLIDEYGVFVGSVGRWGQNRIKPNGETDASELEKDMAMIEVCHDIKCPVYVCGCNYIETLTYDENCDIAVERFQKLVNLGKQKNVKIAAYNCDWKNFVNQPKAWDKILPRVEGLGIKYDLTHAIYGGRDWTEELRDYIGYFYHVHIKGCVYLAGKMFDHPPAGMDDIHWGAFMALLYDHDYQGNVSIEPHSSRWQGAKGQWGLDVSINHIRQFIMPEDYVDEFGIYMP